MNLFIKKAGIRAIKTVCQTAVATIGSATVLGGVNWKMLLSASALSGVLSILTSVATGLPEVEMHDLEYLTVAEQKSQRTYDVDYTEDQKAGGHDE